MASTTPSDLETVATIAIGVEAVADGLGVITVRIDAAGAFYVFRNTARGDAMRKFAGYGNGAAAFAFALAAAKECAAEELECMDLDI